MTWEFILRLALAGLLGGIIGIDREYRAKEAGLRTHFLVSLGSALIMIVSQWGFHDILKYEHVGLDPSRVAAQVVSGIGFIGAGTIILQKQFVRGLTTAAGLWATAGIGLAIGGGLYWLGVAATVLTLVGLEFLRYVFKYIGIGLKVSKLIFTIDDIGKVKQILNDLNASGYHIVTYTLKEEKEDLIRVTMLVKSLESSKDENHLLMLIQKMPDVMLEKFE